jgi:anti-anti-sigma regulatory factor
MNIYVRIYKLYLRQVPIQQISTTTNIPIKTIKDVIARFESKGTVKDESEIEKIAEPFFDYIVDKHHKYVVIELSGMLAEQFSDKIKEALKEALQIPGQILAIKLESIAEVEDSAMKILVDFKNKVNNSGKSVVFLSPSNPVEEYIEKNHIEKDTKVFGTQSAFEEYTFKSTFGQKK